MNKKILSLAVAAAVAAPMAAQADVSVNGVVSRDMYQDSTKTGMVGGDSGSSKLEFNVKDGDAVAKVAWDIFNKGTSTPGAAREQYAGVKVGGMTVLVGRQANDYNAGVKVDTMTANFLEARAMSGGVGKVPSFVSGLIGLSGSAGDVSYGVQYAPATADMAKDATATATTKNDIAAFVKFKAGPVAVGVGYYGDENGESSAGISGKMKFGDIAVAASYESVDGRWTSTGTSGIGTKENVVFADVSMPMGNGTVGIGIGNNTTTTKTFSRLSYQMKMGAAKLTIGGRSSDGDTRIGAGLNVAF